MSALDRDKEVIAADTNAYMGNLELGDAYLAKVKFDDRAACRWPVAVDALLEIRGHAFGPCEPDVDQLSLALEAIQKIIIQADTEQP